MAAAVVEGPGTATHRSPGEPRQPLAGEPAAVLYPSDPDFPTPPGGQPLGTTRWATDFEVLPRFSYELGRLFKTALLRVELEPRVRIQPWPGARITASMTIPVYDEFDFDPIHPDLDRLRPGPTLIEQFYWLKGIALLSGTAGIFTDNRYGWSLGAARPLAGGTFLVDAQADVTGYLAFAETATEYSALERFSGFAGVTWRPPHLDLGVRLRAERFLYGDQGVELEMRRTFEDLDVALFYQRTGEFNVTGVRLLLPTPPAVRRHAVTHPPGLPVRFLPVERLPLEYVDEVTPVGRVLRSVASREEFLRQLNRPGLAAKSYRYRAGRGLADAERPRGHRPWVSFSGMTGYVNTPWAGVMTDRGMEAGYTQIPKEVAYDQRGRHRNDVYYWDLGFVPRIEAGLRWTAIPGLKTFSDSTFQSELTDQDRMLSGRIEIVTPRLRRPGLSLGMEDAAGTRRFHSTYAVAGMPFEVGRFQGTASLGYAPRILSAVRHVLDGGFGAVALGVRRATAMLEYDTEKWNVAVGVNPIFGLRLRAALLDGSHFAFGAGYSHGL